ncbi:MAG TPA: hypothetical protein VIL20_22170 [Sandaracinaceae bacterium]
MDARVTLLSLVAVLASSACGSAPRAVPSAPRASPALRASSVSRSPARRSRAPSLDEQARAAAEALAEGELVASHREPLDGEARLHLVLLHGQCYRLWLGADVPLRARLLDEHGHVVGEGAIDGGGGAWLAPVCPRWSGSFELVVDARGAIGAMRVLVAARAR